MINIISEIISFLNEGLIKGIFVSTIFLLIIKVVLKKNIKIAASFLKWTLLVYCFLNWLNLFSQLPLNISENSVFFQRAFGPYFWAYWIMLSAAFILPLFLLIKKIGANLYFLILVSILINIGWIFESIVIHTTSMHSGFPDGNFNPYLPSKIESIILIKGVLLGLFSLVVHYGFNVIRKR